MRPQVRRQTSQWHSCRLAFHKSDITKKKKRDGCALVEHLINNNHQIGWNNVEILQKEQNTNKRLILEM